MEWLNEAWPFVLVAVLLIIKANRHTETAAKTKAEGAVKDAEELVEQVMVAVNGKIPSGEKDSFLNSITHSLSEGNAYKRALVDGVIHVLEKDDKKKFTPIPGTHPLEQLAARAVESQKKKEQVKQGVKSGLVTVLKIVKGVFL